MKKLLIIALVFIASSFCTPNAGYYATTWAGTSANQGVTYAAFMNAVSTGAISAPYFGTNHDGTKLMRKDSLLYYTSCDMSVASLAAKSNNQLIVKSDVANYANTMSVYYRLNGTFNTCSAASSGSETGGGYNTIYYNGTFGVGTRFRALASLAASDAGVKRSGVAAAFTFTTINSTFYLYEVTSVCP